MPGCAEACWRQKEQKTELEMLGTTTWHLIGFHVQTATLKERLGAPCHFQGVSGLDPRRDVRSMYTTIVYGSREGARHHTCENMKVNPETDQRSGYGRKA